MSKTQRTDSRLFSRRLSNTLGFITCILLLTYGYYLQFYENLEPCPLCIFQRLAIFGLGLIFAVAAIHNPRAWGAKVYGLLILLIAAVGASISTRHVWLQNLPEDQIPACGPGLDYLLDTFSLGETIVKVLRGSGDCAEVSWTFLGLSIPAWTLIAFICLGLAGAARNWMRD